MAISRVIKALNNLSKSFSDIDDDFFRERTKDYGEKIQDRLLDGIVRGYDTEGKTFKGLAKRTLANRRGQGINHRRPLIAKNESILNFLQSSDLIQAGKVQVKLKPADDNEYMFDHNEGFTTGGFLPGKTVPARKWYGIPKTYKEGGTQYELFLNKIIKEINNKIKSAVNES